jgi:hypothetical protein
VTAPICGARTVDLGELTSCILPHGHEGDHEDGAIAWIDNECPIELSGERYTTPRGARALIASLQRQLDALDPDAAIAEAERRMVEADQRRESLSRRRDEARTNRAHSAFSRALAVATADVASAADAWLALVEARDAKGGGA